MLLMGPTINLESEKVRIIVKSDKDISAYHNISTAGAIIRCIKHTYRYGSFVMPKDIIIRILWLAHKGYYCKSDHLDIAQRLSIYEYLKDKKFDDPYLKQFVTDTKENFKHALL